MHRTDDFRRILYGHSELPPSDRKLTPQWESVRDLSRAFVEPCAVDWNGLAELLVTRPGAGSDRRVVRALARVIAGPDDVLLDCACAMGRAATRRWTPPGWGQRPACWT